MQLLAFCQLKPSLYKEKEIKKYQNIILILNFI